MRPALLPRPYKMPSPPGSSGPLRVALFTGNYNHVEDGVSRTLGRLVEHLLNTAHEVRVFGPTVTEPPLDQPGLLVPVRSVSALGRPEYRVSLGFSRSARAYAEAFDPHVVHIATPDLLGYAALRWAERRRLPVVATYHTHFASYLDHYGLGAAEPAVWSALRRFYNRCTEVYVPSASMREVLLEHGVKSTLRLWPRGVDTNRFSPAHRSEGWRASQGLERDDRVVLFASRLVREKGLGVYAEALDLLHSRGHQVRALIVGEGPERAALQARLPQGVFTGHLSGKALAAAYASSDLFLFPSASETFGNVTLEAMASGLSPVVADAPGSKSLVQDGKTGFVCRPHDPAAFADASARLLSDDALRASVGLRAREAALAYDWDEVLNTMTAYYRGVLASPIPT